MYLMNEEALARLEAGLRAQREQLGKTPRRASPELIPADGLVDDPIDLPKFLDRKAETPPG
jgi:hypothetical protein